MFDLRRALEIYPPGIDLSRPSVDSDFLQPFLRHVRRAHILLQPSFHKLK